MSATKAKKRHVLIINENTDFVDSLVRSLKVLRYQVSSAGNWTDALKIIDGQEPPKLVIASANLSDITGPDLVKTVQINYQSPVILILNDQTLLRQLVGDSEPKRLLIMPFDYTALRETIQECLPMVS